MSDEEAPAEEIEDRVEDLESALSDLEAEFEKIMSGEDEAESEEGEEGDMEGEIDLDIEEPEMEEAVAEADETVEEVVEEADETEEEPVEEASTEDLDEESEEKLEEYSIPATAKPGADGDKDSPVAKDGGADESDAGPVGQVDGNTSGGSAKAEDMKTGNVNVPGNKKAPAPSKA